MFWERFLAESDEKIRICVFLKLIYHINNKCAFWFKIYSPIFSFNWWIKILYLVNLVLTSGKKYIKRTRCAEENNNNEVGNSLWLRVTKANAPFHHRFKFLKGTNCTPWQELLSLSLASPAATLFFFFSFPPLDHAQVLRELELPSRCHRYQSVRLGNETGWNQGKIIQYPTKLPASRANT